jgi:hypothetical protein
LPRSARRPRCERADQLRPGGCERQVLGHRDLGVATTRRTARSGRHAGAGSSLHPTQCACQPRWGAISADLVNDLRLVLTSYLGISNPMLRPHFAPSLQGGGGRRTRHARRADCPARRRRRSAGACSAWMVPLSSTRDSACDSAFPAGLARDTTSPGLTCAEREDRAGCRFGLECPVSFVAGRCPRRPGGGAPRRRFRRRRPGRS